MQPKFPIHPAHPERICWGCSRYCPADSLRCGNGSERTQHPAELIGDDWMDFGLDAQACAAGHDPETHDPETNDPETRGPAAHR